MCFPSFEVHQGLTRCSFWVSFLPAVKQTDKTATADILYCVSVSSPPACSPQAAVSLISPTVCQSAIFGQFTDVQTALEINNNIFLVIIFGNEMPQRQRDPFCYDSEKLSFISYMNFWQFQEISALLDNLTCCAQQEIVRLACSHIAGKFLYGTSMHEAGHRLALNILNYYLQY